LRNQTSLLLEQFAGMETKRKKAAELVSSSNSSTAQVVQAEILSLLPAHLLDFHF